MGLGDDGWGEGGVSLFYRCVRVRLGGGKGEGNMSSILDCVRMARKWWSSSNVSIQRPRALRYSKTTPLNPTATATTFP